MTPFVARPFLDATVENLDDASAGAVIGSFFAVLLLFAPAVVLLGMVSPFAIRLAITDVATAGAVAGRLLRALDGGSLLGTFLPALVADPARRHAADAARHGRRARPLGVPAPRPQAARGRGAPLAALARDSARRGQGGGRPAARGGVALPVHPGASSATDGAALLSLNEGVAVHSVWREDDVLDRRRLGRVPRRAAPARAAASARRDPRQRRRDGRAGTRRLLPRTRASTASSSTRP